MNLFLQDFYYLVQLLAWTQLSGLINYGGGLLATVQAANETFIASIDVLQSLLWDDQADKQSSMVLGNWKVDSDEEVESMVVLEKLCHCRVELLLIVMSSSLVDYRYQSTMSGMVIKAIRDGLRLFPKSVPLLHSYTVILRNRPGGYSLLRYYFRRINQISIGGISLIEKLFEVQVDIDRANILVSRSEGSAWSCPLSLLSDDYMFPVIPCLVTDRKRCQRWREDSFVVVMSRVENHLLDKSFVSPSLWLFLFLLEFIRLDGVVVGNNSDAKLWFYGAVNDCFW